MEVRHFATYFKGSIAVILGVMSALLGGFDVMLQVLAGMVITDYILGLSVSVIHKSTNSKVGFVGIFRKVVMFVPVGIAFSLDKLLGVDMLRNMSIMFYIANEGISILENLGKCGVPFPKFLQDILLQLNEENNTMKE